MGEKEKRRRKKEEGRRKKRRRRKSRFGTSLLFGIFLLVWKVWNLCIDLLVRKLS